MSARADARLWIAQRASAAVLAVCVIVHLATIVYAVRGGLSAAEIFARTRGSVGWLAFYSLFVLAVAGDAGCHACHTHMSCTERCPKHISPTAGIAGLKRAVAKATFEGKL